MKKVMTIIAIIAGVVSVVTAVIVVCLYMKDITGSAKKITEYMKTLKDKLLRRRTLVEDIYED